ncbi:hypothetical protein AB0N89_04860 [Amycolatopsis sp. NPDC089917]|uniref:hypothetical protein n=1 Tax=Amycolatopsis sp. NPDC089917 TaxID=3155187 RepID=UPI003443E103
MARTGEVCRTHGAPVGAKITEKAAVGRLSVVYAAIDYVRHWIDDVMPLITDSAGLLEIFQKKQDGAVKIRAGAVGGLSRGAYSPGGFLRHRGL